MTRGSPSLQNMANKESVIFRVDDHVFVESTRAVEKGSIHNCPFSCETSDFCPCKICKVEPTAERCFELMRGLCSQEPEQKACQRFGHLVSKSRRGELKIGNITLKRDNSDLWAFATEHASFQAPHQLPLSPALNVSQSSHAITACMELDTTQAHQEVFLSTVELRNQRSAVVRVRPCFQNKKGQMCSRVEGNVQSLFFSRPKHRSNVDVFSTSGCNLRCRFVLFCFLGAALFFL